MRSHNLIAVLGAEINESYQAELWKGIREEADKSDKYLICFMGSRSGIPYRETHISYPFYGLAHSDNFDGVIVVSSTISTYMDPDRVKALFETRPHIPKISIGMTMAGAGSVCVDGSSGMRDMVNHYVDEHNCRHFALIAGPRLHPESEQRCRVVKETLHARGIHLNEEDIFYGRFDKESGIDGVGALFSGEFDYDALICLNDRMAIGAMEELTSRGIEVPGKIKVSGFDGIEEAAYCTPPLSTVIQPLYLLGETAVRELYRIMGGAPARDLNLNCDILIRHSCSCRPVISGWDDRQVDSRRAYAPGEEWESRTRQLVHGFLKEQERGDLLRNVGITLSASFELETLFAQLARGLNLLGFRYAYLVLYENRGEETLSRLVFELAEGFRGEGEGQVFPSREILPSIREKLRRTKCRNWMFTPLAFQNQVLGHLLLPGNHPDTEIYETLTRQIASSLQGAILWEQVKHHEQGLMEEVKRRTAELTRANKNLRKEIEQRKILEEEVLEISRHTMERIGQDLHDDLCQFLAGTSLRLSAVMRRLDDTRSDLTHSMEDVREMLNDAIVRSKRIVKGLVPLGIKEEGFDAALFSLCRDMSQSYGVTIEYEGSPICDSLSPEKTIGLYRIAQEALNNAIKHSGCREISVALKEGSRSSDKSFVLSVQDRGSGFSSKEKGGMGLRIMSYRGRRIGVTVDIETGDRGTAVYCRGLVNGT